MPAKSLADTTKFTCGTPEQLNQSSIDTKKTGSFRRGRPSLIRDRQTSGLRRNSAAQPDQAQGSSGSLTVVTEKTASFGMP